MKTSSSEPVLSAADYRRMSRVIVTVLESAEAKTSAACLFYAVAGAYLIQQVHGVDAVPIAGAAFYRVDDACDFVVAYGRLSQDSEDIIESDEDAFHCWINCDGQVIDLMAPFFQESLAYGGHDKQLKRQMFQRSIETMAPSPYALEREGDFYLRPNADLSKRLLRGVLSSAATKDLVQVCEAWYRPSPASMDERLGLASNDGRAVEMRLKPLELVGTW